MCIYWLLEELCSEAGLLLYFCCLWRQILPCHAWFLLAQIAEGSCYEYSIDKLARISAAFWVYKWSLHSCNSCTAVESVLCWLHHIILVRYSLVPRPPVSTSVCVYNNTQEQKTGFYSHVLLGMQMEGRNGGGLGTRLSQVRNSYFCIIMLYRRKIQLTRVGPMSL